ncbi:MAG: glutathione S-transferase [Rhodospirillales bacterium]
MKLYDFARAPSPRRVRIFLAEKNVTLPMVQVDLRKGEQQEDWFLRLNPWATVPVLELDDGTAISEASACCRYLEEIYPDPPLLGRTAAEKGVIAMWDHRCEIDGFLAVAEAFRNETPGMKDRALPGVPSFPQIPVLAERGRLRVVHFMQLLDQRLAGSEYLAGDVFTVADITALISIDFAGWLKITIPPERPHLARWHGLVSARPSAGA